MALNPDLVRDRCQEIEDSIKRLEAFKKVPLEEFLADQDGLDIVSYRLLVAIEAAIALCLHVSAQQLRKVPSEYGECFKSLHKAGILEQDLSERLQKMAGFRNLLVHVYWKIEYTRVYQSIQESLPDLRAFCAVVTRML